MTTRLTITLLCALLGAVICGVVTSLVEQSPAPSLVGRMVSFDGTSPRQNSTPLPAMRGGPLVSKGTPCFLNASLMSSKPGSLVVDAQLGQVLHARWVGGPTSLLEGGDCSGEDGFQLTMGTFSALALSARTRPMPMVP